MYSVGLYGEMISDGVRMRAYTQALRDAVKPGSVVLDIGTGTGIFAMLACRFGARRVYAIEPADAIQVARETAEANGCADRIEFIQEMSTRVTLPERADVIVSDLRGVLPLYRHHLPSLIDARERLLAPGGRLIPLRDTLKVAIVDSAAWFDRFTKPWGDNTHGLDMEPARRIVTNQWSRVAGDREAILLPPQTWATLDYTTIADADVSGEVAWVVGKSRTAHGLLVWFDAMLSEEVHFTNAPGEPETVYGNAYFPFPQAIPLAVDDKIGVTISADLVGGEYIWRWNTVVSALENPECIKASFKQSTFFGVTLSPEQLRRTAASFVPTLNEDGEVDRFILMRMNGANRLDSIAKLLIQQFPGRFAAEKAALDRVRVLSKAYSRRTDGASD